MSNVDMNFANDARAAIETAVTPGAWKIVLATGAILAASVLWASVAHVGKITTGAGRVIPSSQVQVVQSLEPGIVAEILVEEGERVEAGQNLIRIDDTGASSRLGELQQQQLALKAELDRLAAQIGRSRRLRLPGRARCRCRTLLPRPAGHVYRRPAQAQRAVADPAPAAGSAHGKVLRRPRPRHESRPRRSSCRSANSN